MSVARIEEVLQSSSDVSQELANDIRHYLETGEPETFKRIMQNQGRAGGMPGGWSRHYAPVPDLSAEDRRILHIFWCDRWGISQWLNASLENESAGENYHEIVRKELLAGGATESDVVKMTTWIECLSKDGQPTSAGRYLLSALLAATKT